MSKRTRGLRILALCASLVVALVGFATPAYATGGGSVAKIGDVEYETLAKAVDAAKNGDTITLIDNANVDSTVIIQGKALTLELNGRTITNSKGLWDDKVNNTWSIISVRDNASLVVNGEGGIDPMKDDCYAFDVQGGSSLTINGGRHVGNLSVVYLYGQSSLTINGGDYSLKQLSEFEDCRYLVNCYDKSFKEGKAKVAINGGTFRGFNPANNSAEGPGTTFLGYGAVSSSTEESKTDAVYTVGQLPRVAETGGKQYVSLADAIANVAQGGTITMLSDVKDAEGIAVASGKNFTVDFAGHTYTIAGPGAGSTNTETNGFQLLKDSTIVFKNGTVNVVENAASHDVARIIQNYANLTLENMRFETANLGAYEDYALSFNNGNVVFKGDTSIVMSDPSRIAFDVCKFSNYPSCTVTFDDTFSGDIGGTIMYDATDPATHALTFKGDGTYAGVKVSERSEDAAKDGIEIHKGSFAGEIDKDWIAADAVMDVLPDGSVSVHVHKGVKVDAVAATCEAAGNLEHWKCTECGKTFSDEAMTDEVDAVVPAKGHNAKGAIHHKAVEPTTTDSGLREHWECPDCHKLFLDAALTKETTADEVIVPALGVTKVTVTFEAGNGDVYTQNVSAGSKLVCPETPVKDGWEFVGWFKTKAANGDVSDKWKFDEDVVTADITLYGGWVKKDTGQSGASTQEPTAALPQTGDVSVLPIAAAGIAGVTAIGAGAMVIARRRKAE